MNYIFTLGGGTLSYLYRYDIATFLLKSYSYCEIYYNQYIDNRPLLSNNYKVYINNKRITNVEDLENHKNSLENKIEIHYEYRNRGYILVGYDLDKMVDYLQNIEKTISNLKPYKWIEAEIVDPEKVEIDEEEYLDDTDYLSIIKKYSGPTGDFYLHDIDNFGISGKDILDDEKIPILKNSNLKIILNDFKLDSYEIIFDEKIKVSSL